MTAEQDNQSEPKETMPQRSARLEAEANELMNNAESDPLAPEPTPEEESESLETKSDIPENNENSGDNEVITALQEGLATAKDQVLRMAAEMENVRKRAQKEREDSKKFAISSFARDLLAVSDNLRRAIESVTQDMVEAEPRIQNLIDGIEATERELLRSFEKNGIEKIEPGEEPFNPNLHEVMFDVPGTGKPPRTIVQVMEIGYSINGRLLRPARVGVAKDDGQTGQPPADGSHSIDTEA